MVATEPFDMVGSNAVCYKLHGALQGGRVVVEEILFQLMLYVMEKKNTDTVSCGVFFIKFIVTTGVVEDTYHIMLIITIKPNGRK